tara:strand:- start:2881 stop:3321 length:441 start_codon:yes stop_codon:yes gene_type:complete
MPIPTNLIKILAPRLPLVYSPWTQYEGLTDYKGIALQNLKMLILTIPGERMMDIEFGVGLSKYLFDMNDMFTRAEISSKIREQVGIYLPYIEILDIKYHSSIEDPTVSEEYLGIKIIFKITTIGLVVTMAIDVSGVDITNLVYNFG